MKWNEIKVETTSEAVEAVANILMEAGASGVAIEDAKDIENFQSDGFGEIVEAEMITSLNEGAYVKAYFPETIFVPEILPAIKERINKLPDFGLPIGNNEIEVTEVAEKDWATAWKKYYHPVRISRFLTIKPSWEEYQTTDSKEQVITLDPGMAFGTGTHPTTRLTLQALETVLRGGETVLDVGTGSGVLSIAASFLGAKEVVAYDLDEVAVKAAKENMALNPAAKNIQVKANDLLANVDQKADVIVANILADIIIKMLPDAWRLLKSNGTLIVSGIIEAKKQDVMDAMQAQGFMIDQIFQQKDWYALTFKKTEDN
ncbi:50S ribosomal protein L11 methyltransferase [Tetragenococcus koreensis]|uniref:Ribosomal protein L11 methyltransferase n=1 Tax=Tetragenococcus koreensis TaxID=290335 RepID=A0AAN4ZTX5_9ENTE|nr:50S ribosomal protein L11 methyltransferase [Tetragenococcus koreensis]AYW45766.1 50S ribosomal protein L11 methyltransferase [Tetragenococcus koreensis]MCF1585953.1 50S ribosomal protein L11 methyltransferase [Tetragenococcus koreensis]MCF1615530.1 50S ribosomal protein L11 methyltransferase [Tetragenococcus koreensis]MCF1618266.1 50S ribosomal protein L11 methyltransferase [Tetragenococcus koreensis]MCF1620395.1 50S ribosomal protein L11 methyltransferase [Tetragenococcus koreensis]